MSNLLHIAKSQLAKLPEVTAFVVTDETGSLIDAAGDIDGEALGAIHVVALQALDRCGSVLGLGALDRMSLASSKRTCVLASHEQDVLGVYLDPTKPLGAFEKKLEAALRR